MLDGESEAITVKWELKDAEKGVAASHRPPTRFLFTSNPKCGAHVSPDRSSPLRFNSPLICTVQDKRRNPDNDQVTRFPWAPVLGTYINLFHIR